MKKIITIMMVLVLVAALAVPALAVEGVTSNEEALYDHFCDVVDVWLAKKPEYADQAAEYKTMALKALVAADLDAAACADLDATINDVEAYLAAENPETIAEMKAILPTVVAMVNATSTDYNIVVAVSSSDQYATVLVDDRSVADVPIVDTPTDKPSDKPSDGGSGTGTGIVKQTGFDMTSTIVVAIALAAALLGSAVVIGKKRLAVND